MNSDAEEEAGLLPEAIGEAASEGDFERVKAWLDGGSELAPRSFNDLDADGWSLLMWASAGHDDLLTEQHVRIARYLVSRGAKLEVASRLSGSTALHLACSSTGLSPEFVSVLVSAGAQVNAEDNRGARPLGRTISDTLPDQMHHVEIVKILLRSGATLDSPNGHVSLDDALRDCRSRDPTRYGGEHFRAIEVIVASVRQHGSWKAHCRAAHKQILRIRSLVARGRVKLNRPRRRPRGHDAREQLALEFVLRQGDNGIVGTSSPTGERLGKMYLKTNPTYSARRGWKKPRRRPRS